MHIIISYNIKKPLTFNNEIGIIWGTFFFYNYFHNIYDRYYLVIIIVFSLAEMFKQIYKLHNIQ